MKPTGAAIAVRALEDAGIRLAFGIPGTHNIELYDALDASPLVRAVLVTDEQSAGFMADGVWRASGELACVNVVPGAGLTHALSGIAEAFLDGVPLLVLGCGIRRDTTHAYQLHDVDQLAIVAPVTKATFRPRSGHELYSMIRQAALIATSGAPGPVMVEVPVDLYLRTHAPPPYEAPPPIHPPEPDPAALDAAITLLARPGARPLLYVGAGARRGATDLVALAECLAAPVATTITGKGVFPERHPLFLWNGFGGAAPPFVRRIAGQCDVTLAIGCRFSEVGTGSYSCVPRGPLVHVDIDSTVFDRNYPAAVRLHSDSAFALPMLLDRLRGRERPDRSGLEATIRAGHAGIRAGRMAHEGTGGVSPARLFEVLQRAFGPSTVYATDSGNGTFLAMECLQLDGPGRFLAPVDYSCMGYAVPAAIGAKLARPETPVVALPGDGAFLMTGLELLTAANQRAPIVTVVLRDRELAQIAQFQATAFNRKVASALPDYDVGSLAEAVGIEWMRVEEDADLEEAIRYAGEVTGAGRPIVIDAAVDYSQPTFFTRGVVRTNLGRLPFLDRLRLIGRALGRRLTP